MAEGTGLENRHTGEPGIESSNLSLSAYRRGGIVKGRSRRFVFDGIKGRVAEWFKAQAWKACVRESVPWVRIPPRPL